MKHALKKIIIAIDGHSSCGKSTLAKSLAKELGYIYVDTGAMYRAVTLYFIQNNIDLNDHQQVEQSLKDINIRFLKTGELTHTFLNDVDVEFDIREMRVSNKVSEVAEISAVRKVLVREQQEMGIDKGLVMDGRDIGTVVFPDAELKIFLTASIEVRTQRRYEELNQKGMKVDYKSIQQNLNHRDRIDSTRVDSPLKQAVDAILIDNSTLDRDTQLEKVIGLALDRIQARSGG